MSKEWCWKMRNLTGLTKRGAYHQRRVLGPPLFDLFINVLPGMVSDRDNIFADDTSPARPMLFYSTNYRHQF